MDFPHIHTFRCRTAVYLAIPAEVRVFGVENTLAGACEYRELIPHHIVHPRQENLVFVVRVGGEA